MQKYKTCWVIFLQNFQLLEVALKIVMFCLVLVIENARQKALIQPIQTV